MRYFLGIDPDCHSLPIVLVDEAGVVVHIQVVEVSKEYTGRDAILQMSNALENALSVQVPAAVTVEGQELYQFGKSKTKNPKSIMFLATVAGMAIQRFGFGSTYFPTPQEWKGSVPKQVHQARVLSRMNWSYAKMGPQDSGYCLPQLPPSSKFAHVKKAHWKHVVDAIGLANYGRERFLEEEARNRRLSGA